MVNSFLAVIPNKEQSTNKVSIDLIPGIRKLATKAYVCR